MSTKWLREINSTLTGVGTGIPFALKCVAMFLRHCIGFSNSTESIGANSGSGYNLSVSAGVVTLTDANANFDSSDVGRSITLSGCVFANNNGTFTITTWTSRTQIKFNNALGVNENSYFSWVIAASLSYWSYSKSGVNGEFTGTDKNFTDTVAGSFAVGDVGKWLVIAGNVRNSGVYKVTAFVSATTVTIDFRSGAAEFPTAELSRWWWLISEDSAPVRHGDYFRLTTPNIQGWAVEVEYNNNDNQRVEVRVSPDGLWSAGNTLGPVCWGSYNSKTCWAYLAVDAGDESDVGGKYVDFMLHQATDNRHNGCLVCNLIPYISGYQTTEKVALMGNVGTGIADVDNGNLSHNYDTKRCGHGYWYRDYSQTVRDVYMMQLTYGGYANGLEKWTSRERNQRRSVGLGYNSQDLVVGTIIVRDVDNAAGELEVVGCLRGHFGVRSSIGNRTAFNEEGTANMIHMADGFAFDWPEITPQH